MEGRGSCSKREGKRKLDEGHGDDYSRGSAPKQQKTPAFGRVMLEALRRDALEMMSYFEPFIRKIFREEIQRCLAPNDGTDNLSSLIRKILYEELQRAQNTCIPRNLDGGSSQPRIPESGGRDLQLRFTTKMPDQLFAGKKVEGEGGLAIHVVLIDSSDGSVIKTGPESTATLNLLVLQGNFDEDFKDGWTHEMFKSHQVKERDNKGPILSGDIQVTLKDGEGVVGDLMFTDNSSWTRTKKFRLGAEVAPGFCEGTCVMAAKTEAFAVLDHRGENNRKHHPPALQDELYRLKGISRDKPIHKKLLGANISTVEDLLRLNAKDPRKLRTILGGGMTEKKWKITIEHAKTCDLSGGKCYVFYTDGSQSFGVIFNHIHEVKGLITDGKVLYLGSLAQTKELSYFVKKAYENWHEVIEYDDHVLQLFATREEEQFGFPHGNAKQTDMEVPFINPETDFVGSSMYTIGETSGAGCSNSLNDCLQPNYGQGLENNFGEPVQIVEAEIMEKFPFINQEAGFVSKYVMGETSGAGCSHSSEDWFPPINSPVCLVYDETKEDTDFNFGLGFGDEMGLAAIFSHSNEACCSYDNEPEPTCDEPFEDDPFEVENGMIRGRAVVGWLKIKVALRWGIMMRRIAAERRAQLIELD